MWEKELEAAIAAGLLAKDKVLEIYNTNFSVEIKDDLSGKYVLMGDIDFSQVEGWGDVTTQSGFELNGNGYAIKNFVIDSSTNSTMHGLFRDIVSNSL